MKAAVYYRNGGPEVLTYEDVPDPVCGNGQVLIKVEAASIEGGDLLHRFRVPLATTPYIVGYSAAGQIIEVGPGVSEFKVGQRVITGGASGSHAELRVADMVRCHLIPDGLSCIEAVSVPTSFGTAHECVFEFGRLRAGETVLVQGAAGGVGLAAVQLAAQAGARVICTASSERRLQRVAELGGAVLINYRSEDVLERVKQETGGAGVNLAVDPVGGVTLQQSLACLAYRGRAITVGQAAREPMKLDVSGMRHGHLSLTGVFLGAEATTPRVRSNIAQLLQDVGSGRLHMEIDRTFPLADAAAAHAYAETPSRGVGRVVLVP